MAAVFKISSYLLFNLLPYILCSKVSEFWVLFLVTLFRECGVMCWGCKHRCCFLSSLLRSLEVIACCPLKNVQILADQELLSCQRGQQKCWMCNFILYTLPLEVYRVFWNPWNRADEPNWSTLIYIFSLFFLMLYLAAFWNLCRAALTLNVFLLIFFSL